MPSGLEAFREFDSLRIKFASPEIIKGWSYGEVTKPETINYRTFKSEKDGLFDERIFGPTKDYECYCGKYKKARFKGIICDKCGVEVTSKRVRRERMGHISLASPVAHIWFFRGVPSLISILLGISSRDVEGVIYFSRYLITEFDREKRGPVLEKFEHDLNQQIKQEQDPANKVKLSDTKREGLEVLKSVKLFSVLSEREAELALPYLKEFSEVMMGAEAIRRALALVDLGKISLQLRKFVHESKGERGVWARRRLRIVEGLKNAGVEPAWFILTVLPVIPPDLRPMVQLEGGRFATSDLNDLYRTVINRNNRLRQLLELGAPEIIVRNEKRMLQEAVDALIDSSKARRGKVRRGKKTLRSFADLLSGKQGRFRQNLLGKRVDYSGRSVIVVGPYLKLNQVGIPREMALELWKPHVLREILLRGSASNLRSAKAYLEERSDEVWEILEQLVVDHPVLLNRAPSLHRLSILGFYPVLVSGSAIQLHPNVCSGFAADFDGDAMAVHLPISKRAIAEVKALMISTNNLLRPATGEPITFPNKEQVLGTYYLTSIPVEEEMRKEEDFKVFGSEREAIIAYDLEKVSLREKVRVMVGEQILVTTVGRVIFNSVLPDFLRFYNDKVDAKVAKNFISQALVKSEDLVVADLVDSIKQLGFHYATHSGVSISAFDGIIPAEKPKVLAEAEKKVSEIDQNYRRGLITDSERKELSRVVWSEATAKLDELAWNALSQDNPIKLIIGSGAARATRDQVKQISGMRGHVVDPTGKVVEMPIRSNYREGLTSFEYFVGARGARKGLVDTALRTADAGYLTRRLVDVAQDVLIREKDCKTKNSIPLNKEEETFLITFARRLMGRISAEDIKVHGKVVVEKNQFINAEVADVIEKAGITEVKIRSPLTCESLHGVCAACYGMDLGRNKPVEIGTPVGVIAAQSIGEPGTQMTLRTKHAGGIATSKDITQGLPRIEEVFEARTPKFEAYVAPYAGKISVSEEGEARQVFLTGKEGAMQFDVPVGRNILVKDGEKVEAGHQLTEGYLDPKKILGVRGTLSTQKYLVNEIIKAYSGQGVSLDDVHIEVILRQMFNKVRVIDPGDTEFIPEEIVTKVHLEQENNKLSKGSRRSAGEPVLLGITRSSLKTDSWLSAASFMETTRILTEAAAAGRVDNLLGLKESVIVGRLIPTGERSQLKEKKNASKSSLVSQAK